MFTQRGVHRLSPFHSTTLLLTLLVLFFAPGVAGQQPEKPAHGVKALESACDGAWLQVQATVSALSHMPKNALDRAGSVRVTCLLDAIGIRELHNSLLHVPRFDHRTPDRRAGGDGGRGGLTACAVGAADFKVSPERVGMPSAEKGRIQCSLHSCRLACELGRKKVITFRTIHGKTTFDADPQMNDVYTRSAVSTLVGACMSFG